MKINYQSANSQKLSTTLSRITVLSLLLVSFQFIQSPADAHDSLLTKVKEFVIGSVAFHVGSNICGLKCGLPAGIAGLAVSTISPMDVVTGIRDAGVAVVTGFEDWGKSFGRP
jgi:hypothetical protein